MPPLSEILDALLRAVLPAAAASAVLFVLLTKLLPVRFVALAGALALAAGFLAGNHFRGAIDYRLDPERLLTPPQFARAISLVFVPSLNEEEPEYPPPAYYWLPWTASLALAAGFAARAAGRPVIVWPIRIAAGGVAAAFAFEPDLRQTAPWMVPVFFAVVLGEWTVLERITGEAKSGYFPIMPAAAGAIAFVAASLVLLHAHTARLADIAVILSASLGACGAAAWLTRVEASSVAPGIAVALPALMLAGYASTFSEVPSAAFLLVAVSPLAFAPLLIPAARRKLGPRATPAVVATLLAAPLLAAVVMAMQAESLSFE